MARFCVRKGVVCGLCVAILQQLFVSVDAATYINYTSARDYTVTSENYPSLYPAHEQVIWRWTTQAGQWAVQFVDFQLSCGAGDSTSEDTLVIRDGTDKNYIFTCTRKPAAYYYMRNSTFTVEFTSFGSRDNGAKGFQFKVFHGETTDKLKMKIDATQATGSKSVDTKQGGGISNEVVIALLVIIVVLLICVIVGVVTWLIFRRRRRRHQQTTNTSVHLNIGAIRRDSAVTYSRNGTGGPPGEGRSRMGSESSLPPDDTATSPKRPVKRSGSNASWAMRAEMSTSLRNGSCSSDTSNRNCRAVNLYSPLPGDKSSKNDLDLDLSEDDLEKPETFSWECPRLSTIPEEPRPVSGGKMASVIVPTAKEKNSLPVGASGYILMTSCSADYTNFSDFD